jgi:hypothetical protein
MSEDYSALESVIAESKSASKNSKGFPVELSLAPDSATKDVFELVKRGILKQSQVEKALSRAINRAVAQARTEAFRQITTQYTIKRKDVANTVKTEIASTSKLSASLEFKGARNPLLKFKVTPSKPNPRKPPVLRVQIRRDGGGKAKGLFVARWKNKYGAANDYGVYKHWGKGRYQIQAETGPSVVSMVGNQTAVQAIQKKAQESLNERINHEIGRILDRKK